MRIEDANMLVINKLKTKSKDVGFSDHSQGHLLAGIELQWVLNISKNISH